ncbi:MAG: DUF6160 family protein [Pseudomonadota bacterium]
MSKSTFNALASLAVLAAAPMAAQAEMTELTDASLSNVSGQGVITGLRWAPFVPTDVLPFFVDGDGINLTPVFNPNNIFNTSFNAAFDAVGDAGNAVIDFHLLPLTGPTSGLLGFNDQVLDNSEDFGRGVADIAFAGPFRVLGLADQGVNTALDFLFLPVSAPLDIAGNFFDALNDGVVGTSSRILTAPLNAVFGPVNRYVDGVTGRFEATVDGAAYAFTEVKGALIAGAFASASQGAANNGLDFTARVFGRISQAQAGLTNNRLSALADKYGY